TDCNRYVAFNGKPDDIQLFDVTGLTLSGCDSLVYRVPVRADNVQDGNLVLISECPFEVLYVTDASKSERGQLKGITASGDLRTIYLPQQLGDCTRYTLIYSVLDAVGLNPGEMSEDEIAFVASVICCPPGGRSSSGDFLSALLAENLA